MKLIEQCKDLFGELSGSNQEIIGQMINCPNAETWEIARRVVVSPAPLLTLDMAVSRVCENRRKGTPDSFTVYRALNYAIKKHKSYLERPIEMGCGG